ncbi:MAG: site-specific integrase [Bryobacteraceae bacterium]
MAGQIIPRGKGTWLIRVYLGRDPETGKREYHNQTIHGNKKEAERQLTETLQEQNRGHLMPGTKRRTIGTLLDDLLADYRINGKDYKWASLLVEGKLRPAFGALPISRLSSDHIKRYIDKWKAVGRANATINHELALLRRAFKLGAQCDPPKVSRVPRIPFLEEHNVRKGFFEHGDYLKLRAELPEELRPLLTFAYYTGCRRGEILALKWSQVDLLEGVIRLEPGTTKNKQARVIPLAPEVWESLKMQRAIRDEKYPDCPCVFFRDGKPIKQFKDGWASACQRAGLWTGDEKTGRPSVLFHDLRRTGVRNLLRAGVPEKIAMGISGHKTRSVFDRYNIVTESDLKDAARRLGEYMAHRGTQDDESAHYRHTSGKASVAPDSQNSSKLLI